MRPHCSLFQSPLSRPSQQLRPRRLAAAIALSAALLTLAESCALAQWQPQPQPQQQDYGQYAPDEQGYDQQYPAQQYPAQQYPPQSQSQYQPQYQGQQQYPPQSGYGPQSYPGYAQQGPQSYPSAGPEQYQGPAPVQQTQPPLNTEQLEQLVAPIALYPDTLVAQALAAATYPAQVVDADHWRQSQGYASPDQIVAGANAQSWDPSIKALTAVPQLLAQMDQNIRWTIDLGNAYYNQPQDVLDVIQIMRQRAQAAGNLQSGPQESVNYDQGYIQVAPANPQLVYLPMYDPWTAYGAPIQPYRGFSLIAALGSFLSSGFNSGFGSSAIRYGAGIAMGAFMHTPWGILGWGLDWLAHSLLFQNNNYYSHSRTLVDWGLPHGGPRAPYYHGAMNARLGNEGFRSHDAYPRGQLGNGYAGNNHGYGSARQPSYARPGNNFTGRPGAVDRGYTGNGPVRPGEQAYNRAPETFNRTPQNFARPQQYARPASPAYGSGVYGNGGINRGYQSRPGGYGSGSYGYGGQQAYRAPTQNYGREAFNAQPGGARGGYSGRGFEGGKAENSGGSHFFGGGGKAPKAPKPPKAEKSHSEKGGHSGGGHGGGGHGGGGHHH